MKNLTLRLAALLVLSMLLWQCGEEADQLTGNEKMSDLQAQAPSMLADGVSELYLVATIVDSLGLPLSGSLVQFATTAGTITPRSYSDQNGEAVAILTSAASEADIEATITAKLIAGENGRKAGLLGGIAPRNKDGALQPALHKSAGSSETESQVILYFVGITLAAQIDKATLCADGISQAQLRLSLTETSSRKGVASAVVQVRNALATLLTEGKTDTRGNALVQITAATRTSADTLFVEYGNLKRKALPLTYEAPKLTLLPERSDLLADGVSSLEMSAVLVTPAHTPIAGAEIQFSCTDGVITGSAVTGVSGEAKAMYRSGLAPRNNVQIIARFHEWADTALVNLVSSAPAQLLLSAQSELLRNGIAETAVRATLLNSMQQPVAGAKVRWTTSAGSIDSVATTGSDGQAVVLLRSDAGAADVTALVRASAAGLSGQVAVRFTGLTLQLNASPSTLPADGVATATITAILKKTGTHQALAEVELATGTSLGELPATCVTDGSGKAQEQLQAGTVPGTAVVRASYGLQTAQTEVTLTSQKPASLQLSVDRNYIWVTGTGQTDQCTITATALGTSGKPSQEETRVAFALRNGPDGGEMLLPNNGRPLESTPRLTAGGSATVVCKAGTRSGTVEVEAWLVDYPEVKARTTQITVRSGPPYIWIDPADPNHVESHMTVALDYLNLDGWNAVREFRISVYVGDKYNNPVEEGTTLYLTSTAGIVTTNTRTDANGRGSAIWTTANPRPSIAPGDPAILAPHRVPNPNAPGMVLNVTLPDFEGSLVRNSTGTLDENDGIGLVMCSTHGRDQAGNDAVVYAFNEAVFSGPVLVFTAETAATTLATGQSAQIYIRVFDINGNPVAKGSSLSVTTSAGQLSSTSLMASADMYGYGSTAFAVTLTNTLNPESDKSTMAAVDFKLESPNGTGTRSVHIYLRGKE
ncbi:MAG TPA: invasin domain 3-containing protein [bacterium]|nr:invasin domain 3-containing protein [bacterium]